MGIASVTNQFSHTSISGISISLRKFFAVTILIAGSLAWFFLVEQYYNIIFAGYAVNDSWLSIGLLLLYGMGAFSALMGSLVSEKIKRKNLLFLWIVLGMITTASVGILQGEVFLLILSVLLGVSFGFGLPSSAALLSDYTGIAERAKVSGVVILATFGLTFLCLIIISSLSGLLEILFFITALRSVSLLGLIVDKCDRKSGKKASWFSVLTYKDFSSYVVPWILFNAAVGLLGWWDIPRTEGFISAAAIGIPLAYICIAFSGFIAGIIADRFGRKQPIIISFAMLGVSFALLSFYLNPQTLLIYYVVYGVAWGFLFTLYLAVPGDLSYPGSQERFYALGNMIPLIVYMGFSAAPDLLLFRVPASIMSPILSILLFLSIIPVYRATETLPAKILRERKLRDHIKKVRKVIEE